MEFEFRTDGSSGPELRARLHNKTVSSDKKDDGADEQEQRVTVRLYRIEHYTGTFAGSGTLFFDMSAKNNWQNLVVSCQPDTTNPSNCTVSATSTGTPSVTVWASFVDSVTTVDTSTTLPTTSKWGLSIAGKSAGDNLALYARVATRTKQEDESKSKIDDQSSEQAGGITTKTEKQVSMGSNTFFSWDTTAVLSSSGTNTSFTVTTTSLTADNTDADNDESQNKLVFLFEPGTTNPAGQIIWDPKIGFTTPAGGLSAGAIAGIVIACVVFVAIIVGVIIGVVLYRRKHRK